VVALDQFLRFGLVISSMQDDVMALLDQELGRHKSKPIRRSCDENARHHRSSSVVPWPGSARRDSELTGTG
jgi:hypothetical protein